MNENKIGDEKSGKLNLEGGGIANEENHQLVFVRVPNEKNPDYARIKIVPSSSTSNKGHFLPLGTKMNSFPANTEGNKDVSNFTISAGKSANLNKKGSSFTFVPSQLVPPVLAKPIMGTTVTLPSGSVRSIFKPPKNNVKVSMANLRSTPTIIRSQSTMNTTTTLASGSATMTLKHAGSSRTSLTPGILRSPSKLKSSPQSQLTTNKTSKPIVLHPQILSCSKTSGGKIVSMAMPNNLSHVGTIYQPLNVNSKEVDATKQKIVSAHPPQSVVLQGKGNNVSLKTQPPTFNIVTKSTPQNNSISVIPFIRNPLSKMVNFKISNGQIKVNPSNFSKSEVVTQSSYSANDDQKFKTGIGPQQPIIKKTPMVQNTKNKDILQQAMSAMVADMSEEEGISPLSTNLVESPIVTATKASENVFVASPVSSSKVQKIGSPTATQLSTNDISSPPISVPSPKTDGLVIRTDSIIIKRKLSCEEKRDPEKPDLSIIPILKNTPSIEKTCSALSPQLNLLCTETFVDHIIPNDPSSLNQSNDNLATPSEEAISEQQHSKDDSTDNTEFSKLTDNGSLNDDDAMTNSDPTPLSDLLKFENGTGVLSGTELKFKMNEFDAIELVEDEKLKEIKEKLEDKNLRTNSSSESPLKSTSSVHVHHSRKTNHKEIKKEDDSMDYEVDQSTKSYEKESNDICCCKNCGCYGLSHEFLKDKKDQSFCTSSCFDDFEVKEAEWTREKLRGERNRSKNRKKVVDKEDPSETKPKEPDECPSSATDFKTNDNGYSQQYFSWSKYLEKFGKGIAKAAPLKLWQDPFPLVKNLFKLGMKLEGIDPQHQSLFCVLTVVDIMGHRIRLHFDGYSDIHDFWCNANSSNLFQAGWCEKNGRKLETPPGLVNFTWKAYLDHCKAVAAPRQAFYLRNINTITPPSSFRIGMKLEAEDRKNGWTCVATVGDILDNRILIHFDGWDKVFDAWFDINSPFLHPVGWCSDNGVYLFPPKDDPDPDSFNWQEYIQETNAVVVPARAFKPRPSKDFKVGMKLEAVDKRSPMLIRVASVVDTKDYKILLNFDGWSDDYNFWVDDDSCDIHPPTWCSKTGHQLQPPLTPEQCADDVDSGVGCGTPGCKGYGHVKGLIYSTHHTAYGCPYSMQNLSKDWESIIPDRLEDRICSRDSKKKSYRSRRSIINLDPSKPIPIDTDDDSQPKRVRKRRKFFDEIATPDSMKPAKMPRTNSDDMRYPLGSSNKPTVVTSSSSLLQSSSIEFSNKKIKPETKIDSIVHQSIFNPFYHPKPPAPKPILLEKHKHLLALKDVNKADLAKWSYKDVKHFITSITGCSSTAKKFLDHKIDGKSLLMVTQHDIIEVLGIKLGPAIKIVASIVTLKNM